LRCRRSLIEVPGLGDLGEVWVALFEKGTLEQAREILPISRADRAGLTLRGCVGSAFQVREAN
jgi:hypothetical protein